MKRQIERLINFVAKLRDQACDDELTEALDNTILALESAADRWVALEEMDEDDLSDEDDSDEVNTPVVSAKGYMHPTDGWQSA